MEEWEDRWKKIDQLGKGGQGTTFLVESKLNGKKAVLKLLNRSTNKQARSRMAFEVTNLKLLADKGGNVPSVIEDNLEHFKDNKITLYFIMEAIDGNNLKDYVAKNPHLKLDKAVDFLKGLCNTIRIAHKHDILHRDIKPENIIVSSSNNQPSLFVVDFGLSFNQINQASLTRIKEAVGNAFLILPESTDLGGNRRDKRSDLTYLVGIFYYLLTKTFPGPLRDHNFLSPHQQAKSPFQKLMKKDSRFQFLRAFFDRGFNYDINLRFQKIEELEEYINKIEKEDSLNYLAQEQLQFPASKLTLFEGAGLLTRFTDLIPKCPILGVGDDLICWLEDYLCEHLKYCSLLADSYTHDEQNNFDENLEDPEVENNWLRVNHSAHLVSQIGEGFSRYILTPIECQFLEQIFQVNFNAEIQCTAKKDEKCLSIASKMNAVFRIHLGAMNYYYIGTILERISIGPLKEFSIPKMYRYIREYDGVVCWRCGDFY